MSERHETWLVAALAVVPLLPFLNAAVSIDAPVFLAVARQVLVAPLDPFGFDMIWDPTSPHVAEFNQNPPLLSYWLAPVVALQGDETLDRELFDTLLEAKVLVERWRKHYNTVRPHSSLGYRPPAPEAIQPLVE